MITNGAVLGNMKQGVTCFPIEPYLNVAVANTLIDMPPFLRHHITLFLINRMVFQATLSFLLLFQRMQVSSAIPCPIR